MPKDVISACDRPSVMPTPYLPPTGASDLARRDTVSGRYLIALVLFAMLSFSFCLNGFSIVPDELARWHGADSEPLVVGRLLESESNGLASHTGFLIHNGLETFKEFRTGERPRSMTRTYFGTAGLQGWVLSAIDLLMYRAKIAAPARLTILHGLVAIALAGVLSFWLYLLSAEFGAAAALVTGVMILYSPWLAIFSDNLYWVPATWFVPAILTWYCAVYRPELLLGSPRRLYLLHATAIAAKALCGFEYITAVAGTSGAVFLYGISKQGWNRRAISRVLAFGLTTAAAIVCAFLIQIALLSIQLGSLSIAVADFVQRVRYRSIGGAALPEELAASLAVPLKRIFTIYLHNAPAVSVPGLRYFNASELLIFFLALMGMAMLYIGVRDRNVRHTLPGLLLVVSGLMASASWHVVARGHSYIHTFLNHVLWFVPALIVLPAVSVGLVSEAFLRNQKAPFRAVAAVLAIAVGWAFYWSGSSLGSYAFALGLAKPANAMVGQRISLRIWGTAVEGTFECDRLDLSHPLFVQLHAKSGSEPSQKSADGTLYKFSFRSRATSIEPSELRYGKCSFRLKNELPFDRLSVGQFLDDSGSVVEWQEEFERPLSCCRFEGHQD